MLGSCRWYSVLWSIRLWLRLLLATQPGGDVGLAQGHQEEDQTPKVPAPKDTTTFTPNIKTAIPPLKLGSKSRWKQLAAYVQQEVVVEQKSSWNFITKSIQKGNIPGYNVYSPSLRVMDTPSRPLLSLILNRTVQSTVQSIELLHIVGHNKLSTNWTIKNCPQYIMVNNIL
eukprot:1183834-Prorocentrum_minimum.AAC.5